MGKLCFILLLVSLNSVAFADECQILVLDDKSKDFKVYASATKGLHIQFYEDMTFGILSNDTLWKPHSNPSLKSHFWLYSKNMSVEDNNVGATFIMASGRSINLVVYQDLTASSCLIVENSKSKPVIAADYSVDNIKATQISTPLITSSYSFDKSMVQGVHDDSRFTHVQLNGFSTGRSVYSVIAVADGVKRVLSNPDFDSLTNTYTLSGIHDELLFQNGDDSFAIKRL